MIVKTGKKSTRVIVCSVVVLVIVQPAAFSTQLHCVDQPLVKAHVYAIQMAIGIYTKSHECLDQVTHSFLADCCYRNHANQATSHDNANNEGA